MSKKDEALKLALEALKELRMLGMNMQWHDSWLAKSETAITAIREALAEQPVQQEPLKIVSSNDMTDADWDRLFKPPASKPWVGLTDEEKSDLWCESTGRDCVNEDTHVFADAIEAKLREKNA